MDADDTENTSLLTSQKSTRTTHDLGIEMTRTRGDIPQSIKDKLGDNSPRYVCVGNSDPRHNNAPTFIHFIYMSPGAAIEGAQAINIECKIGRGKGSLLSRAPNVNVHSTAPNCSDFYIDKGFSFFRVHVKAYVEAFGSYQGLKNRSQFEADPDSPHQPSPATSYQDPDIEVHSF